jgi:predicted DNA-binding transcriptional regulator AlpA
MQRATDDEMNAARRVAEAVVEFLIAHDDGRRLRVPQPTKPQGEAKPADLPHRPEARPEPARVSTSLLADPGQLIGVEKVAELLECSPRTVCRLADGGRLPRPRKVGRLVRWSVGEIRIWVENGCPKHYRRP